MTVKWLLLLGSLSATTIGPVPPAHAATHPASKRRAKARTKTVPHAAPKMPANVHLHPATSAPTQPAAKSPAHPVKGFAGQCVGIVSGDTVMVADETYEQLRVRLYGIAAPTPQQPFAPEAIKYLTDTAFLKHVMVYTQRRDPDDTVLAWVFIATPQGQVCLNRDLVSHGYAWWNRPQAPGEMMLGLTEAEAKGARRGLWSLNNPVPPWEFQGRKGGHAAGPAP